MLSELKKTLVRWLEELSVGTGTPFGNYSFGTVIGYALAYGGKVRPLTHWTFLDGLIWGTAIALPIFLIIRGAACLAHGRSQRKREGLT